ncbi:MAG: tetratricopeptide repeat protein [Deltaproteobacteria bacterium]|nr:tetratricopeptide repeat protein [Deltaproteobacteria bacterium]
MSLIHKALQKAKGGVSENSPSSETGYRPPLPLLDDKRKADFSFRKKSLVVLLISSVLLLGYFRFFSGFSSFHPFSKGTLPTISDNPSELARMAEESFTRGQYDVSLRLWQKALLKGDNAEYYNNMGLTYKKKGSLDQALENYNKALSLLPEYPECLNNLGVLWTAKKDPLTAIRFLQKAIQISPGYADPYLNLAIVQEKEGNLQEAGESYKKFLTLAQNLPHELREKIERKSAQGTPRS